jgi:dephospho-CoA kinase
MAPRDCIFGLTGGVASGKSTVASYFAELGAQVIDADRLGHELIRVPLPAYQEVVGRFGREVLGPAGEIDRKRLSAVVFADRQKLLELNAILHPRIIDRVGEVAAQYHAEDPHGVVIVDAALIYEAGVADRFTKILVAWCRPEQQVERLVAKAAMSREEAERRIAVQMPSEEKRRRADYVIDCSGAKENARAQVLVLYPELKGLVERKDV